MDTKPKKRTNARWPNSLFGPVTVDFVAPFPLETSLKLLKSKEDARWFKSKKISVD
jgi:hypothetical protein